MSGTTRSRIRRALCYFSLFCLFSYTPLSFFGVYVPPCMGEQVG
ncbi:hypothetical protein N9F73_01055 [bacterium]|jgi:hypothetical protein|nr:hypothetical protein [bacterium]